MPQEIAALERTAESIKQSSEASSNPLPDYKEIYLVNTATLKIQVFWYVTSCRLVNSYRRFER
jgi:hypothetical protein